MFLSYSRADSSAAVSLRTRVADAGLKTFLDRYALPGGKPWQPELEAALATCRALIVLLGPAGIGGWQHREIQLGLDRQTGAERTTPFPVIPVLLPDPEPDDYPLGTFRALNTWVAFEESVDELGPRQGLLAAIHGRPLDAPRGFESLRPYRDLLHFREQDAGLSFGRQRFVDMLVAKVHKRSATNVVAVLGRSGSGKSSVVFAGLFPAWFTMPTASRTPRQPTCSAHPPRAAPIDRRPDPRGVENADRGSMAPFGGSILARRRASRCSTCSVSSPISSID